MEKCEKVRELKYRRLIDCDQSIFPKFLKFLSQKSKGFRDSKAKPPNLYAIFDPLSTALLEETGQGTPPARNGLCSIDEKRHTEACAFVHGRWKERGPRRNKFQPVKTARWLTRD